MGNEIRSYFQAELVKVDITGLDDGPMEANCTMPSFLPATKIPIPILECPGAGERRVGSNDARFQARNGGDDFEN